MTGKCEDYIGMRLGYQDNPIANHICEDSSNNNLLDRRNKKIFVVQIIWMKSKANITHYNFFAGFNDFNYTNKHHVSHSVVSSATRPVLRLHHQYSVVLTGAPCPHPCFVVINDAPWYCPSALCPHHPVKNFGRETVEKW